MDRYVNRYLMQNQQVSPQATNYYPNAKQQSHMRYQQQSVTNNGNNTNFLNGSQQYTHQNDWAGGAPLITNIDGRPKKVFNTTNNNCLNNNNSNNNNRNNNGYDYDEMALSRLAKHAHGAPIILSGRYRSKSMREVKPQHSFGHENGKNNFNQNLLKPTITQTTAHNLSLDVDSHTYDESATYGNGSHTNGTCLPRIIKPRKRRKKDRKPIVVTGQLHDNLSYSMPTNFIANTLGNNAQFQASTNDGRFPNVDHFDAMNFKRPAPKPATENGFYNCDFDPTTLVSVSSSSTSSSPISLSNSSLSSTTSAATSSCSCRLCDPFCKIWAFPLRRSFSDNSAVELDHYNNNNHMKKDVGVIGGNRVQATISNSNSNSSSINSSSSKSNWNSSGTSFSFLDIMEFNHYHRQQQEQKLQLPSLAATTTLLSDVDRLRSESLSDSGDSGCDLLLGSLNVIDNLPLIPQQHHQQTTNAIGKGLQSDLISDKLSNLTKQLSDFSLMHQSLARHSSMSSDNDTVFSDISNNLNSNAVGNGINMSEMTFNFDSITKSVNNHSFTSNGANETTSSNYQLMSPMLVNKQIFSNIDINNNQLPSLTVGAVDGAALDCSSANERTLFNCFDVTWKVHDLGNNNNNNNKI